MPVKHVGFFFYHIPLQDFHSVMNIYIKLIYTGAEEGVEVVECTELDLIS